LRYQKSKTGRRYRPSIKKRVGGPLIWVKWSNTRSERKTIDRAGQVSADRQPEKFEVRKKKGLRFQNLEVQNYEKIIVIYLGGIDLVHIFERNRFEPSIQTVSSRL
jgi:hypothetical protein